MAVVDITTSELSPVVGERHVLQAQEELRFEVPFSPTNMGSPCMFILQKGSCELWGCELALGKKYSISNGGVKLALFTWHGCVVDVDCADMEISYTSDETDPNVSYVNTHAQLEALRDEAVAAINNRTDDPSSNGNGSTAETVSAADVQGPRVMVVGPPESGKSSLVKTLIAYATKVGRTPLWVDLDPLDNAISVPGTLTVAPMTAAAVTVETYALSGIPPNTSHALVLWHGSSSTLHPDLFRAQVASLAQKIDKRLEGDDLARSSGVIVNTNGWIQDEGYPLLLYAAETLKIDILLIMGHDRLYSMITNHYKKKSQQQQQMQDSSLPHQHDKADVKILKLPRSGGVVSRPTTFVRQARSRAVKRYFYGDLVDQPATAEGSSGQGSSAGGVMGSSGGISGSGASGGSGSTVGKVPQLTPFLLQLPFSDVQIFKLSSIALSASLLPVAATQSTDAIQLTKVEIGSGSGDSSLQHALLAVCHPTAVAKYNESGRARDLVTAGVAGFCVVERVMADTDTLHLLSPCAGVLPSNTLLMGDITWME